MCKSFDDKTSENAKIIMQDYEGNKLFGPNTVV